jgi:Tfp pilus assembly ATPase PilU
VRARSVLYNAILTTFAGRWRQEIEAAIQDTIKASLEQLHNGLAGSLLHDLLAQVLAPIKDATQLAKLVETLLASPSVQEELVPGMLKGTLFPAAEDAPASARTAK